MKVFIDEKEGKEIAKWNKNASMYEIDSKYIVDALSYEPNCDASLLIKKIIKKGEFEVSERAEIAIAAIDTIMKNANLNFLEKNVLNAAREILFEVY